jgi:hypothetical protein
MSNAMNEINARLQPMIEKHYKAVRSLGLYQWAALAKELGVPANDQRGAASVLARRELAASIKS